MADMLVKLYNIPHSHDIEENLFKSGIRIKKALAPDRSRIIAFSRTSVSHVMRRQPGFFSVLWLW